MKPFVLLQLRPEDEAAEAEYESFCRFGGLEPHQLDRLRVEDGRPFAVDLAKYSGAMMGGGPYITCSDVGKKSDAEKSCEKQLAVFLRQVIERDFPFLGVCYGVGSLVSNSGGLMSYDCGEPVGVARVVLTEAAASEPLLQGIASEFDGFVGHKEGCAQLPPGAELLASSPTCSVQMFRIGKNVFATQFHPELDGEALAHRVRIYRDYGYFPPEEADSLIEKGYQAQVTEPEKILRGFVTKYAS